MLALLGVWTSVAVVYFDLVDYQGVLGEYSIHHKYILIREYLNVFPFRGLLHLMFLAINVRYYKGTLALYACMSSFHNHMHPSSVPGKGAMILTIVRVRTSQ